MKFFKRANRLEGQAYEDNVFISWGRNYREERIITKTDEYGHGNNFEYSEKDDGSYLRIELPFTREKGYIDPNTFRNMRGPCRPVFLRRKRIPAWNANYFKKWYFCWMPVEKQKHYHDVATDDRLYGCDPMRIPEIPSKPNDSVFQAASIVEEPMIGAQTYGPKMTSVDLRAAKMSRIRGEYFASEPPSPPQATEEDDLRISTVNSRVVGGGLFNESLLK